MSVAVRRSSGMRAMVCALTDPAILARAASFPGGMPERSREPAPSARISRRRFSARTSSAPLSRVGARLSRSSLVWRVPASTRSNRSSSVF